MLTEKQCFICKKTKPVSEFNKSSSSKSGYNYCCRTCGKVKKREEYQRNKETYKTYNERNREAINATYKKWERLKIKTDITYRLRKNCRARIHNAMNGMAKNCTTMEYIGCTSEELKWHLESLFSTGMSWDNYGEWQIDHIKPMVSFNLTDERELRSACHYTNLQPLWAVDNYRKGTSIGERI